MSKKSAPKIGNIRLSEQQKEIIAIGVESDFFKVIAKVIAPKRQVKIALTALAVAQDSTDLFYYKGMSYEQDWLLRFLLEEAKKFNAANLDADTEGLDE